MSNAKDMNATLERIAAALERISTTLENIDGDLGDMDSRLYTEDGTDIVDVLDSSLLHMTKSGDVYGVAEVLGDVITAIYDAGH